MDKLKIFKAATLRQLDLQISTPKKESERVVVSELRANFRTLKIKSKWEHIQKS
jgi:hypothetical protein